MHASLFLNFHFDLRKKKNLKGNGGEKHRIFSFQYKNFMRTKRTKKANWRTLNILIIIIVFVQGGPRPHIPFPPDLILYVNLVAKGAPKFFKTLAFRLTVLDIPYFAEAYSRTVRPIDLHNF